MDDEGFVGMQMVDPEGDSGETPGEPETTGAGDPEASRDLSGLLGALLGGTGAGAGGIPAASAGASGGMDMTSLLGALLGGGSGGPGNVPGAAPGEGAMDMSGLLGSLMGGAGASSGMSDMPPATGAGAGMDMGSLLGSLLGGGAGAGTSGGMGGLGGLLGGLLGGGGGLNADGLSQQSGLPATLIQAAIPLVIGALLRGRQGRSAGIDVESTGAAPNDLAGLVRSGAPIDTESLQATGLAQELALRTGANEQDAAAAIQSVLAAMGSGS
jgi:hypothetical protein